MPATGSGDRSTAILRLAAQHVSYELAVTLGSRSWPLLRVGPQLTGVGGQVVGTSLVVLKLVEGVKGRAGAGDSVLSFAAACPRANAFAAVVYAVGGHTLA